MENYTLIPLTNDERDLLLLIFKTRRRLLVRVIPMLYFLALVGIAFMLMRSPSLLGRGVIDRDISDMGSAAYTKLLIMILPMYVLITIIAVWLYRKNIRPFRLDSEAGEKEEIQYLITSKLRVDISDQYYLTIDNPDCLNYEVDADTYYASEIGAYFTMYRAPRSRYFFNKDDSFSIM